jgi:RNA polymerase sigma-70 factor, ECF subfamily
VVSKRKFSGESVHSQHICRPSIDPTFQPAPLPRSTVVSQRELPSDEELVARVLRGEAEAFDLLMDRHIDAAYAVSLALTARPADAEDICQDSFLLALEKLEQCRDPARFRAWLLQIVRNRAHNLRRFHGIRAEVDIEAVTPLRARSNPAMDAERSELCSHVAQALEELTSLQRQVLILFYMEGWSHADIAANLEITAGGSRAALFKARSALRGRLGNLSDSLDEP